MDSIRMSRSDLPKRRSWLVCRILQLEFRQLQPPTSGNIPLYALSPAISRAALGTFPWPSQACLSRIETKCCGYGRGRNKLPRIALSLSLWITGSVTNPLPSILVSSKAVEEDEEEEAKKEKEEGEEEEERCRRRHKRRRRGR